MRIACPCCGYKTIGGIFDICSICYWEHDPGQEADPDDIAGANNGVSLRMAQKNFVSFGACVANETDLVRRPTASDLRDPDWKPLD